MITTGTRTVYEPKDYPVAPWAQAMAQAFEAHRLEDIARREAKAKEDEPCPQT
jgi:hypothetical protein